MDRSIKGVFAAAVTPMKIDFSPDLGSLPPFLAFLAERGCHGALLLGTTGEGPSFAYQERLAIFKSAIQIRQVHPQFILLAGTGTPSLQETIQLTRVAFDLGYEGVVVLPPYYYKNIGDEGLIAWFDELIKKSLPSDGSILGYHIPRLTGTPFSINLIERLVDKHPERFIGIKDSSGDAEFARQLGNKFGDDILVLTGNDRLFSLALQSHASGCITALANLVSPNIRQIWDAYLQGESDQKGQSTLSGKRDILERYPPAPPFLKTILSHHFGFPSWAVRPPLLPTRLEQEEIIVNEMDLA